MRSEHAGGRLIKKARRKNIFHFKVWYERYFVISKAQNSLSVYRSQKSYQLSATIPATEIMQIVVTSKEPSQTQSPYKYTFTLVTRTRNYLLHAPTQADREAWLNAFETILKVIVVFDSGQCEYADLSDEETLQMRN